MKRGDVASNPCARATPPSAQSPETATWTRTELQSFLASDVVREDDDFPLWWILASTGLRRGEALGLQWGDVNLDDATIDVEHNLVLFGDELVIGPPKTKRSRRRVKIGADSVQVLRDHLARQREHRLTMGAGWTDQGLVFPAVDGRPRNPANVSSRFRQLVAKTGLRPATLHGLRHQHATRLLDEGLPVHDVAARLGHDPAVLLRTYSHHVVDSQDRAAALESDLGAYRPPLRVVGDE